MYPTGEPLHNGGNLVTHHRMHTIPKVIWENQLRHSVCKEDQEAHQRRNTPIKKRLQPMCSTHKWWATHSTIRSIDPCTSTIEWFPTYKCIKSHKMLLLLSVIWFFWDYTTSYDPLSSSNGDQYKLYKCGGSPQLLRNIHPIFSTYIIIHLNAYDLIQWCVDIYLVPTRTYLNIHICTFLLSFYFTFYRLL